MAEQESGAEPARDEEIAAELSFEQALAQLEGLIESLDSGRLDLEESLQIYERGVRLVRSCSARLSAAELRVRQLDADGRGGIEERTLEEGERA